MKKRNDNLVNLFIRSVARYPNHPALVVEDKTYTYYDLHQRASALAACIAQEKEVYCGLLCLRGLDAYVGLLAILMAGKIYVPLSTKNPLRRNQEMIKFLRLGLIVADSSCYELARSLFPKESLYQKVISTANKESVTGIHPSSENAYLLFTSGTTGQPKAVMTTHKSIVQYIQLMTERYQPTPMDRFTQLTDFTFDVAIHEIFLCWSNGACLYPIQDHQFTHIHRYVSENKITVWTSVPSMISLIRGWNKVPPAAFSSIRLSVFLGEPLYYQLVDYWCGLAPHSIIDNLYGPTEATIIFTAYRYDKEYRHPSGYLPIGLPLPNQPILILNDDKFPVQKGEVGMLYLGGEQVANGYWCNDVMTKEKFVSFPHIKPQLQWYKTGDYVYFDESVGLIFKGRESDFLKVRGGRLERLEVEIVLRDVAETNLSAIVPTEITDGIARAITAYIGHSSVLDVDIIKRCRERLPDYMVPTTIVRISELPINKNGKVDYKALCERRGEYAAV